MEVKPAVSQETINAEAYFFSLLPRKYTKIEDVKEKLIKHGFMRRGSEPVRHENVAWRAA